MSTKLTFIKTTSEHWERSFGFPGESLRLEFSKEHAINCGDDKVVVHVEKDTELFNAFNSNLNSIYHLGLERAGEIAQLILDKLDVDHRTKAAILGKLQQRLQEENL